MRAIGSATIAFGIVSVPVKLYSVGETKNNVSFNMIHKECGSRLKQQYICSRDGQVVDKENTVKGYEYMKDHYVIFTPEEIKALDEIATQAIEIVEFVLLEKVGREYVEKSYFLGPDKGGERAYGLLLAAMTNTKKAAIGQYSARGTQYLICLRVMNNCIVMEQLKYADEIRSPDELELETVYVKAAEVALAEQLIAQLSGLDFSPSKYHDTVRERTLEAIQNKIDGKEIHTEQDHTSGNAVNDLIEQLKASLKDNAKQNVK